MRIEPSVTPDDLPLYVRAQGSDRMLQAGPSYRIGRDPDSDIVVTDPRVSWVHAVLRLASDGWLLEDSGSTNGIFVDARRVQQVPITGDCLIRLGHPQDGPEVSCSLGLSRGSGHGTAVADVPSSPPQLAQQVPPARQPIPQVQARAAAPPPAPPASFPPPPPPPPPPRPQPSANPTDSQLPSRPPSQVLSLRTTLLKIGRAADNDVVVQDLSVSRYHAQLRKHLRGGFEIVDLGSHNGTFVNGQRVTSAPVTEADLIGVGPAMFHLVGEELQEYLDVGDITLTARELTVTLPSGRVLLDHVSFPLGERCLLGVIGPSGAGKSTLLGALTGMAPANGGGVLYDNRDLYTHYAELRHRIGLVPQDNILHTQLTAEKGLGYAAELRFPPDVSKAERQNRITEVLSELALTRHAQTRVSAMSGGQQKRVNVALELLTKPSLLFLDEPTSGLDPGLDKAVMEQMATLAHQGRTIIVVTHSVANLNLCDRLLVLVPGGKIAYFGPPAEGLEHFQEPGWAEVFQAFDAQPDRDWAEHDRRSRFYRQYIAADMNQPAPVAAPPQAPVAPPRSRNRLSQLSTLTRRYLAVIRSDRGYLGVLAIMPFILGALAFAIPAPLGLTGPGNTDAEPVLLVLIIGACFIGAANSVRELVKERAIYTRERAAGLSAGAYLLSKLVILAVISAAQAIILVLIGLLRRKLPATGSFLHNLPLAEIVLAIAVLAVVSMTLGLLISCLVNSSDKTMPLLVVGVMFQVILTGGIFPLAGKVGLEQVAWISPSRWGFAAVASTVRLNVIQQPVAPTGAAALPPVRPAAATSSVSASAAAASSPPAGKPATGTPAAGTGTAKSPVASSDTTPTDPLWDHNASTWLKDIGYMLALGVLFTLVAWWRIIKIKPGRRR